MWQAWLDALLTALALPEFGLSTVFVVAFLSATLLPLGSEPAVFGLIQLNPSLFWPTIGVATLGNTLGGMVSWWMGAAAHRAVDARSHKKPTTNPRALLWLERFGAKACFLSFLPVVGDPLCAVAGWLRLPLAQCAAYMALGKFLRYVVMTWLLMQAAETGQHWLHGG
ncbi:DedA family protein [Lampropedia puyangensis]|uniref:DedA family protein n=1 Tax=Lampropedia puyangensis TaxID=1330072 RepID=A0A4S8FBG8_9BURK|nr:YqaA family protein [Lampropedia puyangensis]THU05013.1 DedA family protein [Lampropedia puyangensis]